MSWRRDFDAARDPYTARNALGITSTGGGGGGYITAVTPPLQVTGTTLSIDLSAYLTTATAAATYQPLDADLTALAALTGTNVIYYRSAANTWSAVTVGTGLTFTAGVLAATVSGGTPSGANTQIQFNDSGAFGGDADLTWNKTTNLLTANGNVSILGATGNSLQAAGAIQGSLFRCVGSIAVFGSELTSGVVNIRPNSVANATGQFQVQSSGTVVVNGNIELGATDTTLSRVSAGVVSIEGQNILTAATGAPIGSEYITSTSDATLTAERVLTDTATVTWDRTTAGQIKANAAGGTSTTISDTPPGSPTAGSMWWESDSGTLWIYYNDGNTSQWVAAAGGSSVVPGAPVLIQRQDVSSAVASVAFTSGLTTTYDEFELRFFNVHPSTDGQSVVLQVSFDGGATWKTDANYQYGWRIYPSQSSFQDIQSVAGTYLTITAQGLSSLGNGALSSVIKFFRPWGTDLKTFMWDSMGHGGTYSVYRTNGAGMYVGASSTTPITGLRFISTSGNIAAGSFLLYGIKK